MILITGGTGLVGSHLMRCLLQEGKAIKALRRKNSKMDLVQDIEGQIEWIECDILDTVGLYEAMEGIEQVYHCAAVISFVAKDAEWMKQTNQVGTANVVNMALERGVKKLLHVSSIAAIGRTYKSNRIDEKAKWSESKLNTQYAISKYLAEQEVWRGDAEGLAVVIVNPSIILGHGAWESGSSNLFQKVWEGLRFYPKGGSGFIDVLDLVDTMIRLMDSDIKGQRYIVNGANISFQAFFEMTSAILGKTPPTVEAKAWMVALAWRWEAIKAFFSKKQPLITRETANNSQHRYYYDNQKIKEALNFEFKPIRETIDRVGKVFLDEKK